MIKYVILSFILTYISSTIYFRILNDELLIICYNNYKLFEGCFYTNIILSFTIIFNIFFKKNYIKFILSILLSTNSVLSIILQINYWHKNCSTNLHPFIIIISLYSYIILFILSILIFQAIIIFATIFIITTLQIFLSFFEFITKIYISYKKYIKPLSILSWLILISIFTAKDTEEFTSKYLIITQILSSLTLIIIHIYFLNYLIIPTNKIYIAFGVFFSISGPFIMIYQFVYEKEIRISGFISFFSILSNLSFLTENIILITKKIQPNLLFFFNDIYTSIFKTYNFIFNTNFQMENIVPIDTV